MREEYNSVLSTPTEADKIGQFGRYRYIGKTQISARPIYRSISSVGDTRVSCPTLLRSTIVGFEKKGRISLLWLTFSSPLASLLGWKTAKTAFLVLSFFQLWRYSPTVAMSLLSTASTVCQSPLACMVMQGRWCMFTFWRQWLAIRGVDVEEKGSLKDAILEAS